MTCGLVPVMPDQTTPADPAGMTTTIDGHRKAITSSAISPVTTVAIS